MTENFGRIQGTTQICLGNEDMRGGSRILGGITSVGDHFKGKLACENIRFSSLFAAGNVSRETSPAAKSEEKRMFSQAKGKSPKFHLV